jgi:hypothetical protein
VQTACKKKALVCRRQNTRLSNKAKQSRGDVTQLTFDLSAKGKEFSVIIRWTKEAFICVAIKQRV